MFLEKRVKRGREFETNEKEEEPKKKTYIRGLIVNVSSPAGMSYQYGVAYGTGKAAVDRMTYDCAIELKNKNIALLSLGPGPTLTEFISTNIVDSAGLEYEGEISPVSKVVWNYFHYGFCSTAQNNAALMSPDKNILEIFLKE